MYASRNEYDRGVNTFSPEGRLFQVEYALGAVNLGATAIAIRTNEGVVFATEKRLGSILMEDTEDLRKLVEIDYHVACASAGIIADARTLVDHARLECQNHWFTYDERMPVESVVSSITDLSLDFSGVNESRKKVMSRPFGVSLLVGGVDKHGPVLYCCDPSGTTIRHLAAAVGSAHEGAETQLHDHYKTDMTLQQATSLAMLVLRQVMEDKMSNKNVEVAVIPTHTARLHHLSDEEIEAIIITLPVPAEWENLQHQART